MVPHPFPSISLNLSIALGVFINFYRPQRWSERRGWVGEEEEIIWPASTVACPQPSDPLCEPSGWAQFHYLVFLLRSAGRFSSLWLCGPEPARLLHLWGFSRQEYWSGLPCPSPGCLPNPGTEPASLTSPALAGGFLTTNAIWGVSFLLCYPRVK